MNFKKVISSVSALAISVSAFAGLALTAQAETISANLMNTGSQIAGNTKKQWSYELNPTTLYGGLNTSADKAYAGYGYLEYELPTIPAGAALKSATFTVNVSWPGSNGNRTVAVHPVEGFALNAAYTDGTSKSFPYADITSETVLPFNSWDGGGVTVGSALITETVARENTRNQNSFNVTVSDLVRDAYSNSKTRITFAVASGNSGPKVHVSDCALNVEYVLADEHNYTINATTDDGTILSELASGVAQEGLPYSVSALNEVIEKDGSFYRLDDSITNRKATFTMGSSDEVKSVKYNKDTSIKAYVEGETMAGSKASSTNTYEDPAYSGGKARTIQTTGYYLSTSVTLPAGEYTVIVGQGARASQKNTPYTANISLGDITVGTLTGTTSGTLVESFDNINVAGGTYALKATVNYSALSPIDYVIFKRTGDYTPQLPASAAAEAVEVEGAGTYYKAELAAADKAYSKVMATVVSTAQGEQTGEAVLDTKVKDAAVSVYVIVKNAPADITSVTVTAVE